MFNRCGIIKAYEAAPEVLVTPMEPGPTNLYRRFIDLARLYHAVQLSFAYSSSEQALFIHLSPDCTCVGKRCTKCTALKCLMGFSRDHKAKDERYPHCKSCRSAYDKTYGEAHRDEKQARNKAYYIEHKEEMNQSSRIYQASHREEIYASVKARRAANPEQRRPYDKIYRARHRKERREYNRAYLEAHPEKRVLYRRRYRIKHFAKIQVRKRTYRQNNYQVIRDSERAYHQAHKEERNAYSRVYPRAHPEVMQAYKQTEAYKTQEARYRAKYPERYRASRLARNISRRTRETQAGGSFTAYQWLDLKAQYDYTCLCCGKREPEIKLTADHVIPVIRHGTSYIENIQPLCGPCNGSKGTKIIDYRKTWRKQIEHF